MSQNSVSQSWLHVENNYLVKRKKKKQCLSPPEKFYSNLIILEIKPKDKTWK